LKLVVNFYPNGLGRLFELPMSCRYPGSFLTQCHV
jgi:hypothetical protein